MSAFVVWRYENGATILTDGAAYSGYGDFSIVGHLKKTITLPHLNAVIVYRGTTNLTGILLWRYLRSTSYDDLVTELPDQIRGVKNDYRELFPGRFGFAEFCAVGWSESREAWETHSFMVDPEDPEPPVAVLQPQLYLAPEVEIEAMLRFGLAERGESGVNVKIRSNEDLLLIMQAQRETPQLMGVPGSPADDADEGYIVGAFICETSISARGIAERIVHRWPDEQGQLIRIDTEGELRPGSPPEDVES